MDKELKKEIKKINIKLNRIEESVELGTFDNTFLALMIFIIAIGLFLLSPGIAEKVRGNPILTMGYIFFAFIIAPLIMIIYSYAISIFSSKGKFSQKRITISLLGALITYILLVFLLSATFYITEEKYNLIISKPVIYLAMAIIILITIINFIYLRKKLTNFFKGKFSNMLLKILKKQNKKERQKSYKSFNTNITELNKNAGV